MDRGAARPRRRPAQAPRRLTPPTTPGHGPPRPPGPPSPPSSAREPAAKGTRRDHRRAGAAAHGKAGAYTVEQAVRVARAAEDTGLRWFEEPVTSDDLTGLRAVADAAACQVAAGEYGYDLPSSIPLMDAVDCPQADATRCGGITGFLRVAALARTHQRDLSAHCAPHLHAAVMTAIPNARHAEWSHDQVRVESTLFDGCLSPAGGRIRPRDETGNGLTLRREDAGAFRVA